MRMRPCPEASGTQEAGAEVLLSSSQLGKTGGMVKKEKVIIGRTRSETGALRRMHLRMTSGGVELQIAKEKRAKRSKPLGTSPRKQGKRARLAQTRWEEPRGGQLRNFLVRQWVNSRFGKYLLILIILLLLWYYLNMGNCNLRRGDNPNGQSLEKPMWENMLHFFFPTTCILKDNEEAQACENGADLKASECLEGKCCYSPSASNFTCFAPFKNKPTKRHRLFVFGVMIMIGMGCLPIYYFAVCRNSTWFNSLRRKVNRSLKWLKKQRNGHKRDSERLGMAMEGERVLGEIKKKKPKHCFPTKKKANHSEHRRVSQSSNADGVF